MSVFATAPTSFAANFGRRDSIYFFEHFPKAFVQLALKMMELVAVQRMIALVPTGLSREMFALLNLSVKRTTRQWRESLQEVFSY